MVVVVADEQREDEATPQFAEVAGDIVAKLANAVGQETAGADITLVQPQKGCRDERDALFSSAIKAGDDGNALPTHWHEPMFRNLDACLCGKRKRENFTRSNVPRLMAQDFSDAR